jgi:3-oxoacyl-[acyl-carrier protein] reductase
MLRSNPDVNDDYTARIPLRRLGQPRDVARPVLFLAPEDSAYDTGQVLSPNGGVVRQ